MLPDDLPYTRAHLDSHFNPSSNVSGETQPHIAMSLNYLHRGRPSPTMFIYQSTRPGLLNKAKRGSYLPTSVADLPH
jgi:hypothetical protein